MNKVWFVTGCSKGLGKSIAETVLASGAKLAATARNTEGLKYLKEQYGESLLLMELDVTDEKKSEDCIAKTVETFGQIDVLVNNAGYGHVAPFEQMTSEDFRAQIETNLFGVVNLTKAALPYMRRQKSGHIFQISSVGGRSSTPGLSAYQAAKWAVGGFSEVVAKETAPFGVKVCSVEPGGMRTEWADRASSDKPHIMPDYEPTVGSVLGLISGISGSEMSSPEKVAQVLIDLAERDDVPAHLLIGTDALHFCKGADAQRKADMDKWESVTVSTVIEGTEIPNMPHKD